MYRVELSKTARATYTWLCKHDQALYNRIDAVFDDLTISPFSGKRLKGELHGLYSYRVGSYRIIYSVLKEKFIVYVLDIGHRREVYR